MRARSESRAWKRAATLPSAAAPCVPKKAVCAGVRGPDTNRSNASGSSASTVATAPAASSAPARTCATVAASSSSVRSSTACRTHTHAIASRGSRRRTPTDRITRREAAVASPPATSATQTTERSKRKLDSDSTLPGSGAANASFTPYGAMCSVWSPPPAAVVTAVMKWQRPSPCAVRASSMSWCFRRIASQAGSAVASPNGVTDGWKLLSSAEKGRHCRRGCCPCGFPRCCCCVSLLLLVPLLLLLLPPLRSPAVHSACTTDRPAHNTPIATPSSMFTRTSPHAVPTASTLPLGPQHSVVTSPSHVTEATRLSCMRYTVTSRPLATAATSSVGQTLTKPTRPSCTLLFSSFMLRE
eukprot:Rhum_TRINITY_DN13187_c0_g2::Rhum_TRINITY_DN13187_c0_g2_i1::g.57657::m.57657